MDTHQTFQKISAWFSLSRLPFHTVGILPFILGTLLSWKLYNAFEPIIFILGVAAVILIMLSTYQSGEYFDYREDQLSKSTFNSRFSGGSGVIPARILPRKVALWTSIISLVIAALIGLVLQFFIKTGPYTLILGISGSLPGFFYSTKPIRLVEKGIGELFIGFCYGWLPVASAFYIQTGYIHPIIHWISLPIGLTIFNVILLNEYPDYQADKSMGKKNLLVRLGHQKGIFLYAIVSILALLTFYGSVKAGVSARALYCFIPFFIISAFIFIMMQLKKYTSRITMEILCGLNIAVNLGTTFSYMVSYL